MGGFAPDTIGYGAGDRNPEDRPNVLRLVIGQSRSQPERDEISILETNLDDVSPEVIGYCCERLFESGALDVYTTPIAMKKNRPACKLTVMCEPEKNAELESILFSETGTLGIRRTFAERSVLNRRQISVDTEFGPIRGMLVCQPDGDEFTPEFDSCRIIAKSTGSPIAAIYDAARFAFLDRAEVPRDS